MKLHLIVASGSDKGRAIPVKTSPFMIGRHPMCDLRPSSLLVSTRHCTIWQRGDSAAIEDQNSTNGTRVNGERIVHARELHHGDELSVGPLTFEVQIEALPAVDTRTPIPQNRNRAVEDAAARILLEHCNND
jgi:pSer/pThr/pTyr-binding forkhead associated (FHA) protein